MFLQDVDFWPSAMECKSKRNMCQFRCAIAASLKLTHHLTQHIIWGGPGVGQADRLRTGNLFGLIHEQALVLRMPVAGHKCAYTSSAPLLRILQRLCPVALPLLQKGLVVVSMMINNDDVT